MTRDGFVSLLQTLGQAWTARDYDKAITFFADDVRYGDPTRYNFNGRSELLRFFQDDEGYQHISDEPWERFTVGTAFETRA